MGLMGGEERSERWEGKGKNGPASALLFSHHHHQQWTEEPELRNGSCRPVDVSEPASDRRGKEYALAWY